MGRYCGTWLDGVRGVIGVLSYLTIEGNFERRGWSWVYINGGIPNK